MTIEHGLILFVIGMTVSIVGMFIAYYIGSKPKKKKELPKPLKELFRR